MPCSAASVTEHGVDARTGAARSVQRCSDEHEPERDHRHPLQDAEGAGFEPHDVLRRRARSS